MSDENTPATNPQGERRGGERRRGRQADEAIDDLVIEDNPALRAYIGRHLGEFRRLHKYRQAAVAEALGLSRPHLSNIELGRSRTSWGGLRAMAEYYHLGLRDVIDDCSSALAGGIPHHGRREARVTNGDGEKVTTERVTEDELFILRLFRLLATSEQRLICAGIVDLVKARSQQIINHEKKV